MTPRVRPKHTSRCSRCNSVAHGLRACAACGSMAGFVVRVTREAHRETRRVHARVDAAFGARPVPVVRLAGE